MIGYIKQRVRESKNNSRERYIYGDKVVYLKDQLPYGFDLNYVLETVENLIPRDLVKNVDVIYIGSFPEFENGDTPFNAKYKDGALYITNDQDSENDMIDDIVHEIAHAVEEQYGEQIYGDMSLENEFKGKRNRLYDILGQEGYDPSEEKFKKLEYDKYLDHYLYNVVGYPTLTSLCMGLFYSPYAITSLREYYASGFENYFLRDSNYLKKISPALYKKITSLLDKEEENEMYVY